MRILAVCQFHTIFPSKVGDIARYLQQRGHEPHILCVSYDRRFGIHHDTVDGIPVASLGRIAQVRKLTFSTPVVAYCLRHLRTFQVVHVYGMYDLIGPAVAWFCRRWGIPYVVEPMGMYRPIVRSLTAKRAYRWALGRPLVDGAARVIATSEQERQELTEEGIRPDRIVVRWNGLDLREFETLPPRGPFRRELGLADGEALILYLGRLSRKKGLDLLLQAFAELPPSTRLAIVGPDDWDGTTKELMRLQAALGIGDRIWMTGPRYGREKIQVLTDADVLVLPSRNENFGNVAAEAIACGVPVVITDRCGIAPYVRDRGGLVVPYDRAALADALRRVLADQVLRGRFHDNAAAITKELSWDGPIAQMDTLYAALAAPRDLPAGHR